MVKPFELSDFFTGEAIGMALAGGVVLGVTVMFKTRVTGEVLGVSGSTRGLLMSPSAGKFCFIAGLIISGAIMNKVFGGFEELPGFDQSTELRTTFLLRMFFGGALVGFGTALGNGCTSGHGLTGLARLALRSWVAVPTFMISAVISATAFGTATDIPPRSLYEETPSLEYTLIFAACLVAAVLLAIAAAAVYRRSYPEAAEAKRVKVIAELFSGLVFGAGLCLSTMVRPSKVAGFLDLGSGVWDGSLAFVMGGALCITFPFYQTLQRISSARPFLGGNFGLPPKSKPVDRSLVIGAILFGFGWGTCGMCPGPMWVALGGKPTLDVGLSIIGLIVGLGAWVLMKKFQDRRAKKVTPASGAAVAAAKIADVTTVEGADATEEVKAFSGPETDLEAGVGEAADASAP